LPFNKIDFDGRLHLPSPIDKSYWPFDDMFHPWQAPAECILDEGGIDAEETQTDGLDFNRRSGRGRNCRYIE